MFAAVPGTQQDGRKYINDAAGKGAVAVLAPDGTDPASMPSSVRLVTTPDVRVAVSAVASRFYPRQPEHIAAVTGTSGKTSIAQFTRELWTLNGHNAASVGTLGFVTPTENRYGSLTTPDAVALHQILDEAAGKNITHLALEASSHGLDLHRLDHVRVAVAAFTNLSRDHLDYHDSMESYLAAKLRLFTDVMPEGRVAVLNADVPEYETLSRACRERRHTIIGYGKNGRDIRLTAHKLQADGQVMRLEVMGKNYEVLLPVAGEFQVWNSLCALGMAIGSGDGAARSVAGLEKLTGVPGRLERIGTTAKGGTVFVDYAHKPGALENVLAAMKAHTAETPGARLHVVFGCGGNRDKGKRPQMGSIAQRLADAVYVTDDNPRNEVPAEIRRDILAGCTPGPNLREIGDRAEAIQTAIAGLSQGDVLVIAGKGHEIGQIVGDKVLPFDDAEVARQALHKETA
ncbi:MAG: UDP-N-acetylmuramoyl-L-alanyl-D-glutamate--2,6-diaminopimelate ligase [Alphaproteobacteria bacterium]|nr:UDP-N-acetylmuramoyl-L-alanyl-D-glutamate--2,6-diaminopimelate ligase [Alphaproteobacteria bacterium]